MSKRRWLTRKQGTPAQIGSKFPIASRRKPAAEFKEQLRKLKPSPKAKDEEVEEQFTEEYKEEEPTEYIEEFAEEHAVENNNKLTLGQVYNDIKNAANTIMSKIGLANRKEGEYIELVE